jgi:hypothetical protein
MAQTLDIQAQDTEGGERALVHEELRGRDVADGERPIDPFLSELARMTPEERIRASRYSMNRHERWVYARHYPEEVPTVNGELEWIAMQMA